MRYLRAIAMGSLLVAFAGCQGAMNAPALYGPINAPDSFSTSAKADGDGCGGSGGVTVQPCPVTLTKKHPSVDVMVVGTTVVTSAIKTNKKNRSGCRKVCGVGPMSSNPLEYYILAGTKCASATLH